MQELILVRHAEAETEAASGKDQDRVLTTHGMEEARAAGVWLATHGVVPNHVLCSPARRAEQTARLVLRELGSTSIPDQAEEIYNATPGELLALLDQYGDARAVLLIGHNPGLERLVALLVEGRSDQFRGMPPAGLAILQFSGPLEPGNARLGAFWSP